MDMNQGASFAGVLFDNDGTLVDTYDLILESFVHALREVAGVSLPASRIMQKVGQPLFVQVADLVPDRPELHERILESYRSYNHEIHDQRVSLFPGVKTGLQVLSNQGLRLGVVTSKRKALAQHGLEILAVSGLFDCVIGFDDCTRYKPDGQPVELGCAALGLQPSRCVYVGDSPYDIQAGQAAGCKTVAVAWGMFSREELIACNPDALVSSFPELVELLQSWMG